MSKYPVSYFSESKRQDVNIEDMHDGHLCNATRKRENQLDDDGKKVDPLYTYLMAEVKARGLDLQYTSGRAPLPETAA